MYVFNRGNFRFYWNIDITMIKNFETSVSLSEINSDIRFWNHQLNFQFDKRFLWISLKSEISHTNLSLSFFINQGQSKLLQQPKSRCKGPLE